MRVGSCCREPAESLQAGWHCSTKLLFKVVLDEVCHACQSGLPFPAARGICRRHAGTVFNHHAGATAHTAAYPIHHSCATIITEARGISSSYLATFNS